MEWVKGNTPDGSMIYSNYASRLRFNTGRITEGFEFVSRDDYYAKLLAGGFDYVAPLSMRFTQKSFHYSLAHVGYKMMMWYLADPDRYTMVYSNESEDAAVWEIKKSTAFVKAFDLTTSGLEYYASGNVSAAGDQFNKALEIYPDMSLASINITRIYLKKKEYDKALETMNRAILAYPASDILFAFRGWTYMMMEQYGPAMKDLREALSISEYHGRVQFVKKLNEDILMIEEKMQAKRVNPDGSKE